ncbi:MAG: hypothetical protein VB012_06100 [Erysipelotrichaceae bacterium]|nr:hypothetical protein [Erysipelotrichaceae bacterium]
MKIKELAEMTNWQLHASIQSQEKEIRGAFVGDLLSWVMGHSKPEQAWITVQAHINVVAVGVLREFSCLIICEDSQVDEAMLAQALEENLPIFQTTLSAFDVCRKLIELGV